jgi:hypothetical protein
MPIRERTAKACVDVFVDHISALVAATVPTRGTPFLPWRTSDDFVVVGFRKGQPAAVPLQTCFGRLHFYLCQAVEAAREPDTGTYRLRTLKYWYRLQREADPKAKALVRWEYDRKTDRASHSRHHVQLPATLPVVDGELDFDKLHLPTGWVTIESVIRFLVVDLGVEPPCGDEWAERLHESEERFFNEFTGKREPALPEPEAP